MHNPAEEIQRQAGLTPKQKKDQFNTPMTKQQQFVSSLAKGQASRDENMNTEDWKAEEKEAIENGQYDVADSAASQIRKTDKTYKAPVETNKYKDVKPNQEATNSFKAVVDSNPILDEALDEIGQEAAQDIANTGNAEETAKKLAKKHNFPWDVLLTVVSGVGAMMGVTPLIDFTQFGFDVTNKREEARALSQGRQKGKEKVGQGQAVSEEQEDTDAYNKQVADENLSNNAAAMAMQENQLQSDADALDKQLRASFENLGLQLATDKELAYLDSNTKLQLQSLTTQAQKELAKLGYEHSEKMPQTMASAAYAAFKDAQSKGYKGTFTEWMRNNEGRAFWQDALGAANELAGTAINAVGAIKGGIK